MPMSSDANRYPIYHICHALLQNIDVHVDPCSPKRETLTLTLILTLIVEGRGDGGNQNISRNISRNIVNSLEIIRTYV